MLLTGFHFNSCAQGYRPQTQNLGAFFRYNLNLRGEGRKHLFMCQQNITRLSEGRLIRNRHNSQNHLVRNNSEQCHRKLGFNRFHLYSHAY